MIRVVVLKMSDIVFAVTGCFDIGYASTDGTVLVVSLGLIRRGVVNVFTTTEEVGLVFSLV